MGWEVQEEDSFGLLARDSLSYTFVEGHTSETVTVAESCLNATTEF